MARVSGRRRGCVVSSLWRTQRQFEGFLFSFSLLKRGKMCLRRATERIRVSWIIGGPLAEGSTGATSFGRGVGSCSPSSSGRPCEHATESWPASRRRLPTRTASLVTESWTWPGWGEGRRDCCWTSGHAVESGGTFALAAESFSVWPPGVGSRLGCRRPLLPLPPD